MAVQPYSRTSVQPYNHQPPLNDVTATVPQITTQLIGKGKNTIGHETNLARSPIWRSRLHSDPDETMVSPSLFGRPFKRVEGDNLSTSDQRLFAHLTTVFVRSGCPDTRQVPFSLGDAATVLGYEDLGGRQRALVRRSLGRLRSVTFESALRHADGHETILGWGLIDSYLITTKGGGKGWVKLSETVAHLLREGSVTFLHAPTWRAISSEDEVAGRLWTFLESETIGKGWRYSLFGPELNGDGNLPSMPSIAELLQLAWSSRRRRVAQRVREACTVIERHDRRYQLTLDHGSRDASWVLTCVRRQESPHRSSSTIPDTVTRAWRRVYRSHLPSQRQRRVLAELLTRRSPEWITRELENPPAGGDPFRNVLDQDRELSVQTLSVARAEESRWEERKRHESASGEQSLLELIGSVRAHFSLDHPADQ